MGKLTAALEAAMEVLSQDGAEGDTGHRRLENREVCVFIAWACCIDP